MNEKPRSRKLLSPYQYNILLQREVTNKFDMYIDKAK